MNREWVVTAAAEQVDLDEQRTGEATFTVTNRGEAADRVVFDPVAGGGADLGWFSVDDPQRLVRGGMSVSYLVKVAVPPDVAPGPYELQGRVYSADAAPEESSVLSPRVKLEVSGPAEASAGRKLPWWVLAAGSAVVLLLVVLGVVILGGRDESGPAAVAELTGPTSPVEDPVMPDLIGMSEQDATTTLSDLGLTVRPIQYRYDPEQPDRVVKQLPEADRPLDQETIVDLVMGIELAAPVITAPAGVPQLEPGDEFPIVVWEVGQPQVRRWQITWSRELCGYEARDLDHAFTDCEFPDSDGVDLSDAAEYTPNVWFPPLPDFLEGESGTFHSGWVQFRVAALDDFGAAGPASEPLYVRGPVL